LKLTAVIQSENPTMKEVKVSHKMVQFVVFHFVGGRLYPWKDETIWCFILVHTQTTCNQSSHQKHSLKLAQGVSVT